MAFNNGAPEANCLWLASTGHSLYLQLLQNLIKKSKKLLADKLGSYALHGMQKSVNVWGPSSFLVQEPKPASKYTWLQGIHACIFGIWQVTDGWSCLVHVLLLSSWWYLWHHGHCCITQSCSYCCLDFLLIQTSELVTHPWGAHKLMLPRYMLMDCLK